MRLLLRFLCVCVLALPLLSCRESKPARLRAGLLVWVGYSPFYVAAEKKLFANVDAEITTFSARTDLDRAFADKSIDIATSTLFGAIRLADQGVDLKVIMVVDASSGADGIVARQGIASVRELKGKRVATDVGSVSHFLLLRALELSGMSASDVEIVNVTLEQASVELREGKVDAAVTWEPFLSKAVAGGARLIFTSESILNEIVDVLLVSRDTAEHRREELAAFLRGWEGALGLFRAQPAEVVGLMARTQGMKVDELAESLKGLELLDLEHNQRLFGRAPASGSLFRTYEATARFMTEAKLLRRAPPPAERLLDGSILAAAAAR